MSGDFWTRRREAVAQEALAEAELDAREEALRDEQALEARSDAEILEAYDLPDPDTLDDPEAVKDFLQHALPQRLKTRAMRRLWRLNPVLANVDGLVDYGEDFTDAATVIENLQTAYQVGKGMLAHIEHTTTPDEEEADQVASAAQDMHEDEDVAPEETDVSDDDTPVLTAATPAPAYEFETDDTAFEAPQPARRRMTFQFESQV